MAIFAYEPERFNAWLVKMNECITGGDSDTVQSCVTKFKDTMESLLNDQVWTGPGAVQNYKDFETAYDSFKNFSNQFSSSFNDYMKEVATSLNNLEATNSIEQQTGILVPEVDAAKVETILTSFTQSDAVVYDYARIQEIKSELSGIINILPNLEERINKVLNELDSGERTYDGNKAASIRENLSSILKTGISAVKTNLDKCAANIQQAAENAAAMDK